MSKQNHKRVLEVVPPKDDSIRQRPARKLDDMLLSHPHRLGIVAPSRSGKTNLIVNMLLRDEFYKNYFHVIYVWTPTFYDDPKWKLVDLPENQIFTEYNENDLIKIVENIQKDTSKRTLMIFDDCISEKGLYTNVQGTMISKLVFRGRHWNISLWFVSQSYKAITRGFRVNMTGWIFFNISNIQEIMKIAEENAGFLDKKQFLTLFKKSTEKPYSFLFVNYQCPNPREVFRQNFEEIFNI